VFNVVVGGLRLDIWTNGQGVVSRQRRQGETRGPLLPIDPEGFNPLPMFRAGSIGFVVASTIACAGAGQLVRTNSVPLALALFVLTAVLAAFGGIYLQAWIAAAPHHRRYVVLDPSAAEQFRVAAEAKHRALGRKPRPDDRERAADQLWDMACQMSGEGTSANEAEGSSS
jgi:hypothetical protein